MRNATKRKASRRVRRSRQKLSTTLAPENYQFLQNLARRSLTTLAATVDRVVEEARRTENRALLAAQTEAYFAALSPEAQAEEQELGDVLSDEGHEVDFERG